MLPSLTAVFLLGLLCGSLIPYFPATLFSLLMCAAVGLSLLERSEFIAPRHAVLLYATLLSGVVYWTIVAPPLHHFPPPPSRREVSQASITGRIVAPAQQGPGRQIVLVQGDERVPQPVRIRLVWREPGETLYQGDRVVFHAKVHAPNGLLNPGGFDYAAYAERQGIELMATVTGPGRWNSWSPALRHGGGPPGIGSIIGEEQFATLPFGP